MQCCERKAETALSSHVDSSSKKADVTASEGKVCRQVSPNVPLWNTVQNVILYLPKLYISFIITDGQKVAKRISRQIGKEGTKVKQLMEQYNVCAVLSSDPEQLTLPKVLDPTSQFWSSHSGLHVRSYECGPVPLAAKQDMIRFCLQKERSLEETQLLQVEMLNTLEYFWIKGVRMKQKVQELLQAEQTDFIRGSISILCQQYVENEFILKHAVASFTGIVPIPADVLAMVSPCDTDPVSQSDDFECFYDSDESSDADF